MPTLPQVEIPKVGYYGSGESGLRKTPEMKRKEKTAVKTTTLREARGKDGYSFQGCKFVEVEMEAVRFEAMPQLQEITWKVRTLRILVVDE